MASEKGEFRINTIGSRLVNNSQYPANCVEGRDPVGERRDPITYLKCAHNFIARSQRRLSNRQQVGGKKFER